MTDESNVPGHDHATLIFPDKFLWGAATSAFQVEGNVKNSEWWTWEQSHQALKDRSGMAADQYHLYEQDFDLAQSLSHNTHRLSIEWSRIEPLDGVFSIDEIDHYKAVLSSLKQKNMKVMLTLHHFSNPLWFAKLGGWTNNKASFYFERFVKKIVPELKEYVDFWITINEPNVYCYLAYRSKHFPPQKKNWWMFFKSYYNMAKAHKKAYAVIHEIEKDAKVGFANNTASFSAFHHHNLEEDFTEYVADIATNHSFYMLTGIKTHDFLGVNYYQNQYISLNGEAILPNLVEFKRGQADVSDLGWEILPEGIFDLLMDFSDYHLPIYITENGIASTNDDRRVRFLISYLKEIYHALQFGVDIRGYYYWSLIDNMELDRGFDPRFGLIGVDFKTQERTVRPSALVYQDIIKFNGIPHHLLKLLGHSIDVGEVIKRKQRKGISKAKLASIF